MGVLRISCFLAALLAAGGCGTDRGEPSRVGSLRSARLLTTPPVVADYGRFGAQSWLLATDEATGSTTLTFIDVESGEKTVITPAGSEAVLSAFVIEKDDEPYLLVASVNAQDELSVFRFRDADGDGGPDASTESELIDWQDSAYVTCMASDDGAVLYLLDAQCQDILVATDTDGDEWADTVSSIPFATSQAYPTHLTYMATIRMGSDGVLRSPGTVWASPTDPVGVFVPTGQPIGFDDGIPYLKLPDADEDGVLDGVVEVAAAVPSPEAYGTPSDGEDSVSVVGHAPSTIEIWAMDGTPALLGARSITTSGYESVALTRPLQVGERIVLRYAAGDPTQAETEFRVANAAPQIVELSTPSIPLSSTIIQVLGRNFTQDVQVTVAGGDGSPIAASSTFVSTSRIDVTVPALPSTQVGHGRIVLHDPSKPEGERETFISILICDRS